MKQQQMSCRDIELLYRQRAVLDCEHSWKWLGEAERWEHLAQKETASRFKGIGPMAMGPKPSTEIYAVSRWANTLGRMHNRPAQVT
jgi:hypothetical protein